MGYSGNGAAGSNGRGEERECVRTVQLQGRQSWSSTELGRVLGGRRRPNAQQAGAGRTEKGGTSVQSSTREGAKTFRLLWGILVVSGAQTGTWTGGGMPEPEPTWLRSGQGSSQISHDQGPCLSIFSTPHHRSFFSLFPPSRPAWPFLGLRIGNFRPSHHDHPCNKQLRTGWSLCNVKVPDSGRRSQEPTLPTYLLLCSTPR